MTTKPDPASDLGRRERAFQQEPPLLPPNVIEIRLSALLDGLGGQVRWELEVLEGAASETTKLLFVWLPINSPNIHLLNEMVAELDSSQERISPF